MQKLSKFINITARCGKLYQSERLSEYGINDICAVILLHLFRTPGVSQENLADNAFIDKSGIARHLSRLEQNGFITRCSDENDRRSMLVFPTQKAIDVLPVIRRVYSEWNGILTSELSEEEKIILEELLRKMCIKAKEYIAKERKQKK